MPHIIRKPGILGGTTLAVFMTLVHTVNDAMTAILGALLPTLQVRFDAGPTALALMVAVFWIASSVTQPVFGALGEDVGLRVFGCVGVLMASTFLSLIGVASELWLVFVLLVIGGLGSAALHPIGTTIAGSQASNATVGVGLLLPQWEPHPRRPLRRLFDLRLARGPVGRSPSRACSARWRSSHSQAPSRSGSCTKTDTHPTQRSLDGRSQRSPSRAASARSWAASLH